MGALGLNLRITLCLGVFFAFACASAPRISSAPSAQTQASEISSPCWLRNPCPPFLPSSYLIGVGGGAEKLEADDAARADLAKVLKVQIHENLQMVEKSYSSHGIYGVQSIYSESISREVRSETDLELEGVEIVRRFHDGRAHHSLAILERAPALTRIDAHLVGLERESESLVDASASGDAIEGLRAIARAAVLSREYASVNAQRSIIHGGGQGRPQKYGPEDLSARLESFLKGIGIVISLNGDQAGELETVMADELTAHGFELVPEAQARLALKGEFKVEVGEPDDYGFRKVLTTLVLSLQDAPAYGERVYRVLEYSSGASSRKQNKALKICRSEIEQALRKRLDNEERGVLGTRIVRALLGDENGGDGA